METLFIPTENDFRKWIKEAIDEYFQKSLLTFTNQDNKPQEDFLNRKEMAKILRVSLVTLTDWMRRGLPCHKQRGRVYFMKSEVVEYIQKNRFKQVGFMHRFP